MRLIDADEIKLPNDLPYKASVKRVLIQAPTVDAEPVVHGKWLVLGQRTYGGGRCYTHYCSECGRHGFDDYERCPNCGAKMDGGKET